MYKPGELISTHNWGANSQDYIFSSAFRLSMELHDAICIVYLCILTFSTLEKLTFPGII